MGGTIAYPTHFIYYAVIMATKNWGFDVRDIDTKVRPQDDFFHYASGAWMKKHPIPNSEARWGSFTQLRQTTDVQLHGLLKKVVNKKRVLHGSPEQMIGDFYRSGADLAGRRRLGLTPIKSMLERIGSIQTPTQLMHTIAHLERVGLSGIWGNAIDQDMKNSEKYLLYFFQSGLGMPDRDYYLKNDAESVRVREAYVAYLERLLTLSGRGKTARDDATTVYMIEKALAKISMKKEDIRDVDKTYHKMTLAGLTRLAPTIDWPGYFKIIGAAPREVIVMQPDFIEKGARLLASAPIEDWKTYLVLYTISGFAGPLTPELEKASFAFYGTTLSGTTHMKPLWRRILRTVNGSLDELFGELYVAAHFGKEAKRKVSDIVDDLFRAYEARIKNLDWMTPATKNKAVKKLRQMNRKLGYPDKWKSYRGLMVRADDYAGNLMRTAEYEHRREMRRLSKPVDRKEWFMSPQTVNAYCSFGLNDIVFPAAILQHPFFDAKADDAFNYGAMGSVIGHEITHGFDDQGSKFDGQGNRKTWWTGADRVRFEKKSKRVVQEFSTYEIEPGTRINGRLTLGENIADLGGLSIAFDAYMLRLKETGHKTIGGFK